MEFSTRQATKKDLPEILSLIKELALYVKAPEEVTITIKDLEKDGFGENPIYWIILAENEKEIMGMSFYYIRYSTWKGKSIYLEDLVVKEKYRRQKVGKTLFEETIKMAKKMNIKYLNWQVLEWNKPAINFYKKFEAQLDDESINAKLIIK